MSKYDTIYLRNIVDMIKRLEYLDDNYSCLDEDELEERREIENTPLITITEDPINEVIEKRKKQFEDLRKK